jgi:hypothetical protein
MRRIKLLLIALLVCLFVGGGVAQAQYPGSGGSYSNGPDTCYGWSEYWEFYPSSGKWWGHYYRWCLGGHSGQWYQDWDGFDGPY